MFILDSNRYAREAAAVSQQLNGLIEKLGGQLLVSRLWDERRLAYPIKSHRKGTYWLTYFKLDSQKLTALTRECQLTDSILREIFVRIDPRLVDALVEHAKSGAAPPAPEVRTGDRSAHGGAHAIGGTARSRTPAVAAVVEEGVEIPAFDEDV
jgi:small subunit ribosomal protein S6